MTTIQIKHRWTGAVLFECEAPEGIEIRQHIRHALEKANKARADLSGSNLRDSDLSGSNLSYSNLRDSDLSGSNLRGSDLSGSNLSGSNLSGSNLRDGLKLIGNRPVFQIGPIGSRQDFFTAYITNNGLLFDADCQRQITRERFEQRLAETHGDNMHAREYRAALALIDLHAELWTPKEGAA